MQPDPGRRALAWSVHLFTASGGLCGLFALIASAAGAWHAAVLWMLVALFIDGVDGFLARRAQVERYTPRFDGRRLDDIVDFLNYTVVPLFFLVQRDLLPHPGWAVAPLLASAYGFAQEDAKTEDHFFLGFPSYWNVIAIYAHLLPTSPAFNAGLLSLCALLVFVPIKYVYPTRMPVLRRSTCALALVAILLVAASALWPQRTRALRLLELSLAFPAWYLLLSLRLGGLQRRAT